MRTTMLATYGELENLTTFDSCLPRKIVFAMLVYTALLAKGEERLVERVLLISIDGHACA